MWTYTDEFFEATLGMKRAEAEQHRLVTETQRQATADRNAGTWRWHVEPGMGEAFRELLGWLLSSQRDAPAESASTPTTEPSPAPQHCPPVFCWCEGGFASAYLEAEVPDAGRGMMQPVA